MLKRACKKRELQGVEEVQEQEHPQARRKSARLRSTVVAKPSTSSPSPRPTGTRSPPSLPSLARGSSDLPYYEYYQAQKKGRTPFYCVPCSKNFGRSALSSHIKTKHKSKTSPVRIDCHICGEQFHNYPKALEHLSQYHKIYDCFHCSDKFHEFDRLKSHLKSVHQTDWPWICGFCDLALLYELEFEIHVKQHTDECPYGCPRCKEFYQDTAQLREHLCKTHMPRLEDSKLSMMTDKKNGVEDKKSTKTATADSAAEAAAAAAAAAQLRDENAVNREIAALLLNLHASRSGTEATAATATPATTLPKAEDLSLKTETAIDLTKGKSELTTTLNTPLPASISKLAKAAASVNGTNNTPTTSNGSTSNFSLPTTPANPYSFYPSLASMTGLNASTLASMNSNYLLQNLLLGKMQQIAAVASTSSTTSGSSSSTSSPLSFPTQPLPPAQALSLPSVNVSSLKPPASVMKSALPTSSSIPTTTPLKLSTSTTTLPSIPASSALQQLAETGTSTNIPLLCGQIVAQLNGLLFLVHSLNNSQVELSLQTQLSAIYTRLQEVVAMVEQAKKVQEKEPKTEIQKQLEKMKESKLKEEEKIAKHIQDYQRALLQQHEAASSQIAPLKETSGSSSVVDLLKKQAQANLDAKEIHLSNGAEVEMQEVESTSGLTAAAAAAAARRRRGRPPKNSNMDLSYSPPEKRSRASTDHQHVESTTPLMVNGSEMASGSGTKSGSGKGIRNRVFCGECAGCLKNDDCGRCRYCQDKTKFGGQNRLRQKCLHRRCQMDTHRKRSNNNSNNANANNSANNGSNATNGNGIAATTPSSSFKDTPSARQSPSPNAIYSGVDLARLAATAAAAEKIGEKTEVEVKEVPSETKLKNGEKDEKEVEVDTQDAASTSSGAAPERRSTRSRQKSSDRRASLSDDESSDGGGDAKAKSQSRIDRWKAKHEAMLKLATEGKGKKGKKKEANKEQEEEEQEDKKKEEEEPELPNIEPQNGVCIDLKNNLSKPHTRHSAAVQQQQALSV